MKLLPSLLCAALCTASSIHLQAAVYVDDTWADGTRTNWNTPAQCPWFHNKTSTGPIFLGAQPGTLYMTNYDASLVQSGARYYWTYFTTNEPSLTVANTFTNMFSNETNAYFGKQVEIGTNQMIRVTFRFIPEGYILPDMSSGVRFALLSYENSPFGRVPRDSANGTKSGTNVTGYRVQIPMCGTWTQNTVFSFHSRTNMNIGTDSQDPLGKAADWISIGGGPSLTNIAAFQLDNEYTIQFTVSRYAGSNIVACDLSGPMAGVALTNFSRSYVDSSTSNYFKFDCFAIRMDGGADTLAVDRFAVKNFKVEVLPIPGSVPGPFRVTGQGVDSGGRFGLSWESEPGFNYNVLSAPDLNSAWVTNATVTAGTTLTSWTNSTPAVGQRFYRVSGLPN